MRVRRREFLKSTGGGMAAAAVLRGRAWAQTKPIRIGYTLSATGPYSVGAGITQGTGYALWLDQVNAKGGLAVKGEGRRPIEYVTIDDRSEIETAVRYYEKLMGDDKVDLILPPWGTAMNFAVAPIANKYGYPMIGPTVSSNKLKELSFPYFYAILQQPDACMGAFTAFLKDLKGQGKVSKIGVAYVNDLFGIEMHASLTTALKDTGLDVVDTKSYSLGVKDLSPVLKGFKAAGVDVFLGLTYPPDNMLAASQAKEVDFNPPVYLSAVGTAFPFYRDRFKGAEGVSGIAGWNPKMKYAGAREYYDAHVAKHQKEPDRWASAHCWAGLQILQAAIEKVGMDRKAIREFIATGEHATIIGPVRFKGSEIQFPGTVSQWVGGDFDVVWPADRATAKLVIPKPAWK